MPAYRRKAITVEAWRYPGGDVEPGTMPSFLLAAFFTGQAFWADRYAPAQKIRIRDVGDAREGDWVIFTKRDGMSVCKADDFDANYGAL